jgi:uncharacterized membrane protein
LRVKKSATDIILYFVTIIFALLFLYYGNRIASEGMVVSFNDDEVLTAPARIINILDRAEYDFEWASDTIITFEAEITGGFYMNQIVTAMQYISWAFNPNSIEVSEGDSVILFFAGASPDEEVEWHYMEHERFSAIVILGIVFIVLLLIFGRLKGLSAILSLGFTCAAIFLVLVPSILSGRNIYVTALIVCTFSIIITLFIVYGINKKSLAAVVGCFGGVIAASVLTLFMSTVLNLTGMTDGDSGHLLFLPTENPIDLKALVFAGIIIGAVGAVMDVAVSISSALSELKASAPELPFKSLFKSGMNIGRDIMASMTNTLVLAYIGSSLTVVLLLITYAGSLTELFNRELVVVELLQALIGSLGILLTMPLTTLISAALYSRNPHLETIEYYEYIEDEIIDDPDNYVTPLDDSDTLGTPLDNSNTLGTIEPIKTSKRNSKRIVDDEKSLDRLFANNQREIEKKLRKYRVSNDEDSSP